MSDSWEAFSGALQEESAALGRVHEAGMRLTEALVHNSPAEITLAERGLDGARRAFASSSAKRRSMMTRGFGKMTLRQVCRYAPRRMSPVLGQRLYELTTLSINVKITSGNNKALIAAGMERLIKITSAMQKAANAGPQTYKRRGFIPPPTNSVLVSSRA
jgi:hypothetical protein